MHLLVIATTRIRTRALEKDITLQDIAITAAHVPTLKVSEDNNVHVPKEWLEESDDSDVEP